MTSQYSPMLISPTSGDRVDGSVRMSEYGGLFSYSCFPCDGELVRSYGFASFFIVEQEICMPLF